MTKPDILLRVSAIEKSETKDRIWSRVSWISETLSHCKRKTTVARGVYGEIDTQAETHCATNVEPILMEGAWGKTEGEPETNDSNSNRRSQDEAKDN